MDAAYNSKKDCVYDEVRGKLEDQYVYVFIDGNMLTRKTEQRLKMLYHWKQVCIDKIKKLSRYRISNVGLVEDSKIKNE